MSLSFHHYVTEPGTCRNELRSYNGHPSKSDCQPQPGENPWQGTGYHNVPDNAKCAGAHRSCGIIKVTADILDACDSVQDDGKDAAEDAVENAISTTGNIAL